MTFVNDVIIFYDILRKKQTRSERNGWKRGKKPPIYCVYF